MFYVEALDVRSVLVVWTFTKKPPVSHVLSRVRELTAWGWLPGFLAVIGQRITCRVCVCVMRVEQSSVLTEV